MVLGFGGQKPWPLYSTKTLSEPLLILAFVFCLVYRSPTGHYDRELEREKERRVQEFVENRAAQKIQKGWRKHHQAEEEEVFRFSVSL